MINEQQPTILAHTYGTDLIQVRIREFELSAHNRT